MTKIKRHLNPWSIGPEQAHLSSLFVIPPRRMSIGRTRNHIREPPSPSAIGLLGRRVSRVWISGTGGVNMTVHGGIRLNVVPTRVPVSFTLRSGIGI